MAILAHLLISGIVLVCSLPGSHSMQASERLVGSLLSRNFDGSTKPEPDVQAAPKMALDESDGHELEAAKPNALSVMSLDMSITMKAKKVATETRVDLGGEMYSLSIEELVDSDDEADEKLIEEQSRYHYGYDEGSKEPERLMKSSKSNNVSGLLGVSKAATASAAVIADLSAEDTITFEPDVWNSNKQVLASHNCFMYALNDIDNSVLQQCTQAQDGSAVKHGAQYERVCRQFFHKPGYFFQQHVLGVSKIDQWTRPFTTCNFMMPQLFSDNPTSSIWADPKTGKTLSEEDECPEQHYMAALVVDPERAFHFYRRDHACLEPANKGKTCWSHKPGITRATNKDAAGKEIVLLRNANRKYGKREYSKICGVFCVPFNAVRQTHSANTHIN